MTQWSDSIEQLDQHQQRRAKGLPTVSVLVGPVGSTMHAWRKWSTEQARPFVVADGADPTGWLRQWLQMLVRERNLYVDAESFLRRRLAEPISCSPSTIAGKTPHELELLFEHGAVVGDGMSSERLCRWLLLHRATSDALAAEQLFDIQSKWQSEVIDVADSLEQLLGLLPDGTAPALLLVVRAPNGEEPARNTTRPPSATLELLHTKVRQLANIVNEMPQLTSAIAISEPLWNAYVEWAPASHAKAMIQEHVIRVESWSTDRIQRRVVNRIGLPFDGAELATACETLAQIGTTETLVQAFEEAAIAHIRSHLLRGMDRAKSVVNEVEPPKLPAEPEPSRQETERQREQEAWNSAQERFLFELLEHTADLTGRFQLNANPGFLFGNMAAEVDLLCVDLKIAIEIDGYYHFTSFDHYRRDRRKDIALQRRGFLVLRFLADDIVPRMASILEAIRDVVRFRESQQLD